MKVVSHYYYSFDGYVFFDGERCKAYEDKIIKEVLDKRELIFLNECWGPVQGKNIADFNSLATYIIIGTNRALEVLTSIEEEFEIPKEKGIWTWSRNLDKYVRFSEEINNIKKDISNEETNNVIIEDFRKVV